MGRLPLCRPNDGLEGVVEPLDFPDFFVLFAAELHVFEVVDGEFANDSVLFEAVLLGRHQLLQALRLQLIELALLLLVLPLQRRPLHLEFFYLLSQLANLAALRLHQSLLLTLLLVLPSIIAQLALQTLYLAGQLCLLRRAHLVALL